MGGGGLNVPDGISILFRPHFYRNHFFLRETFLKEQLSVKNSELKQRRK